MPSILMCGAEGEQALFENTLSLLGADDKRRGSVLLGAGQQMARTFDTPVADMWVHVRFAQQASALNALPIDIVRVLSGTTSVARITNTGFNGDLSYVRFDVGGTTGPVFPQAPDEFINYDIRLQSSGGTITVSFYRNEVLRHRTTVVASAPDGILIQYRDNKGGYEKVYVQDVIVTNALPTVGMELAVLVPSAVGTYDDFSNDYTAIDDFGYDQSSVISTTAINNRESWFFADPEFNLGDKVIYGVAITSVAQTDLLGAVSDFRPFLRIGAANYTAAAIGANNIAPNAYVSVFQLNPATGAPWQKAELVGLEAGIVSV